MTSQPAPHGQSRVGQSATCGRPTLPGDPHTQRGFVPVHGANTRPTPVSREKALDFRQATFPMVFARRPTPTRHLLERTLLVECEQWRAPLISHPHQQGRGDVPVGCARQSPKPLCDLLKFMGACPPSVVGFVHTLDMRSAGENPDQMWSDCAVSTDDLWRAGTGVHKPLEPSILQWWRATHTAGTRRVIVGPVALRCPRRHR